MYKQENPTSQGIPKIKKKFIASGYYKTSNGNSTINIDTHCY